jgi:hypothetical protein
MKTLLTIIIAGVVSTAVAQVQTAENVANSTVRGTKKAAETVAHGVKKAADTVEDAIIPDSDTPNSDERRVDVTMTDDKIDMPTPLKPGRTAFVVKNAGTMTQNFEVAGHSVDRKFVTAPGPGETKVLHVTLHRGNYTVYSPGKNGDKKTEKMTLRVH